MSYEKHTWETGEVITAEKLNYMENGIENANQIEFFIVHFTDGDNNTKVSDKTAEEIGVAIANGKIPLGIFSLSIEGLRMGDGFCFINCFTGSYLVEFNGTSYRARQGNVWESTN